MIDETHILKLIAVQQTVIEGNKIMAKSLMDLQKKVHELEERISRLIRRVSQ